jgi:four helix bundle protein
MIINSFEDIIAWQKSKELTIAVYKITSSSKDYGYNDQLKRASVSVMNNIAEGFERQSNRDFRKFLYIAKGSCGEVRSMLRLGEDLGVVNKEDSKVLIDLSTEISRMLSGFIKKL